MMNDQLNIPLKKRIKIMELDFTRLDVMDTIIERITQSHAVLQGTGSFIDDETSKKLTKSIEKEGKRHIRRISKLARKVRKERKAAARQLMLEEQVDEAIEETAEIETVADETPVVQDEQQTQAEQAIGEANESVTEEVDSETVTFEEEQDDT